MKISIIIPAHNEEDIIEQTIRDAENNLKLEHELIIVDDHSTDSTNRRVKDISLGNRNIRLIENKNSPGFANALIAGFMNAASEIVVPVMADLCDDIKTLGQMYEKITEGFDIVCGSRYIKGGARIGESKLKGFFSYFVGRSLHSLTGIPTNDAPNAFKMYRKRVIGSINIKSKGFEVSMEIILKAFFKGFKITEVPTVWQGRTKGVSKFKVLSLSTRYFKLYIWAIIESIKRFLKNS